MPPSLVAKICGKIDELTWRKKTMTYPKPISSKPTCVLSYKNYLGILWNSITSLISLDFPILGHFIGAIHFLHLCRNSFQTRITISWVSRHCTPHPPRKVLGCHIGHAHIIRSPRERVHTAENPYVPPKPQGSWRAYRYLSWKQGPANSIILCKLPSSSFIISGHSPW